MANIDSGKRVMSGTFGYLMWDGDPIAEVYKMAAKYSYEKEDVTFSGQMIADSKVMGVKGTGSMGIQKVFSRFRDYADAAARGEDVRSTLVSNLADPDAYGAERVALYNVSFDEVPLINWEHKTLQKDEVPFTFTSHKFLESVEAAT